MLCVESSPRRPSDSISIHPRIICRFSIFSSARFSASMFDDEFFFIGKNFLAYFRCLLVRASLHTASSLRLFIFGSLGGDKSNDNLDFWEVCDSTFNGTEVIVKNNKIPLITLVTSQLILKHFSLFNIKYYYEFFIQFLHFSSMVYLSHSPFPDG